LPDATQKDIVQWDYGSWPGGLPKKDGANALSGAGALDTATTHLNGTSRTKNLRIEYTIRHSIDKRLSGRIMPSAIALASSPQEASYGARYRHPVDPSTGDRPPPSRGGADAAR